MSEKHISLRANEKWAKEVDRNDRDIFPEPGVEPQKPHTLWIGCADSRVSPSLITGARPGELFVHRNIANLCQLDDNSVLAVLRYAVDVLEVDHVAIVGHTHCGGVEASLKAVQRPGFNLKPPVVTSLGFPPTADLNPWLAPLTRQVARYIADTGLDPASPTALDTLIRENVKQQVRNLSKSDIIHHTPKEGQFKKKVDIHGWVYHLETGCLEPLELLQDSSPNA